MKDMEEYTISKLAEKVGLSRSTLLYYDEIGLLRPSFRESTGYRFYNADDLEKLRRILELKEAGFKIKEILEFLEYGDGNPDRDIIEERIKDLNRDIRHIRQKQRMLGCMLKKNGWKMPLVGFDKASWMNLLHTTGVDDEPLKRFHIEFEKKDPVAHRDFMTSLGIDPMEIEQIQQESRQS